MLKPIVTDSIFFKKNMDLYFFQNEMYDTRIILLDDELILSKEPKFNKNTMSGDDAIALVSQSNYRLINDLFYRFKSISFYAPEYNKKKFSAEYYPDKEDIEKRYKNYLTRGFLSFIFANDLKKISLKRIEQLITIFAIDSNKFNFNFNSISFQIDNETDTIEAIETIDEHIIKNIKDVNVLKFISAIAKKNNQSFYFILKEMLQEYAKLNISDPFLETFEVISQEFKYNQEYNELKEESNIIIQELELVLLSGLKVYISVSDIKNSLVKNYLEVDDIDLFFEGYIFFKDSKKVTTENVLKTLIKIMDIKDALLTIELLIRMKFIKEEKSFLILKDSLSSRIVFEKNSKWADTNLWAKIYAIEDRNYAYLLKPLNVKDNSFICPICSNKRYQMDYRLLRCENSSCGFKFSRNNLKKNYKITLSDRQILQSLKNDGLLLYTNKRMNPFHIKKNGNLFYLWYE